jgi:GDP-L-fucose synthase
MESKMIDWKGKKVFVTGSNGLIGQELVLMLKELGAEVLEFDIKRNWIVNNGIEDIKIPMDVRNYQLVYDVMKVFNPEYVFHLFGIKGSPKMTNESPLNFMIPMLQGDTNVIRASIELGVKRFLYTSSIAVENPESDKYPAWAKMTGETLLEASRIQYPEFKYCIVRPANVYGRFDNFNNPNPMVVTSLIRQAINNKSIHLMTDGTEIRDFINAKDVAIGMLKAIDELPILPVNLCSGMGVSIKELCNHIINNTEGELLITCEDKKADCMSRVMKVNWNFKPEVSLEDGIKEVIEWKLEGT